MSLRFAIATTPELGAQAFTDLAALVGSAGAPELEPMFLGSYASLCDAVHMQQADVAWCPPLVARELLRIAAAEPIATVLRGAADHYYAAIVSHPESGIRHLSEIGEARIGWVSQMSAAGYIVPRAYLRSIGMPLSFRQERFLNTHGAVTRALAYRQIDVAATYATRDAAAFRVRHAPDARILATAGPIPGDVIVVGKWVAPNARAALASAFARSNAPPYGAFARLMDATGFTNVAPWHLRALDRWFGSPERASQLDA